jgi:hypothetical protein
MWLEPEHETEHVQPRRIRRAARIGFELPVRCKRGVLRTTVMLRDMTTHGARIDGLEHLHLDEPITLLLPGLQAKEAYVAWHRDLSAGLEFDRPLHPAVFDQLVADFALKGPQGGPELPRAA